MNQERLMQVLLAPQISEKATFVADKYEQVIFRVTSDATKPEVKGAVELLFKVSPVVRQDGDGDRHLVDHRLEILPHWFILEAFLLLVIDIEEGDSQLVRLANHPFPLLGERNDILAHMGSETEF